MLGVIEGLKPERGFGFIDGQDGAKYFFHAYTMLCRTKFSHLAVGQEVTFKPGERNGKLAALEVEVKDSAAV